MPGEFVTFEEFKAAEGMVCRRIYPAPLNLEDVRRNLGKPHSTWPKGLPVPDDIVTINHPGKSLNMPVLMGQKEYKYTAAEMAAKLGTTPRQIRRLRNRRTTKAKKLEWYAENDKPTGGM